LCNLDFIAAISISRLVAMMLMENDRLAYAKLYTRERENKRQSQNQPVTVGVDKRVKPPKPQYIGPR